MKPLFWLLLVACFLWNPQISHAQQPLPGGPFFDEPFFDEPFFDEPFFDEPFLMSHSLLGCTAMR